MNWLKIDKAWTGVVLSIIFSAGGIYFFTELNQMPWFLKFAFRYGGHFSHSLVFILGVCCNLIPFSIAQKQKRHYQMQGIVGIVMVLALGYFAFMIWNGKM